MGAGYSCVLLVFVERCFFGGEESYLLLEGESRRRSRLRT